MDKIEVTYSRNNGPSTQNVTKLATKVDLRFHVKSADWIAENVRNLLLKKVSIHSTHLLFYLHT